MEPEFFKDGQRIEHTLEHLLHASGWAILAAVERQRMAVMNVKGHLAEYYLNRQLVTAKDNGPIPLMGAQSWEAILSSM